MESMRFGDVEIDFSSMAIRNRDRTVHVEPQVFDVLAYLAVHRDGVVTKNELLDNVWGDRFVSESALTSRIKDARKAVGDDGRAQRVIRTVHGRGYQFVAQLDGHDGSGRAARTSPVVTPPSPADGFIGRERELGSVLEALGSNQLVTLVGPGGVGKTRLAMEAAKAWEDEGRSVHVVELDALASHTDVAHQICDALGVRSQGDLDMVALAAQELRGGSRLLVLDNFEHVAEAAMDVRSLMDGAPELRICVTSRERLRISDETVIGVEPLDASPELGIDAPAVALFQTLARRTDPSFGVDASNLQLVSEICHLVDGLPLGLDLAAAQLAHVPLDYLRAHLEKNAASIGHDLRDRPERQQTVSELIGWSYHQLTPSLQRLLVRLSVFRGTIPLSGVRWVGEFESDIDALRAVGRLVDKSLVHADTTGTEPNYVLLNLIRSFGLERLGEAGDETTARSLHAGWVADQVAAREAGRWDQNVSGWLDEISWDHPNVATALEYLAETDDHATLGQIVADTNLWWYRIGRHDEARRWVEVALEAVDTLSSRTRGRIHFLAGLMAFAGQDMQQSTHHYGQAIDALEDADDWRYLQLSRANYATRALAAPDVLPEATAELEAVVADATARDEPAVLAHALNTLGVLLHRTGREAEARVHHEQAVRVNRRIGDRFHEALNHANLGHIEVEAGRAESALVSSKAALTLASRIGASLLAAWMLAEIASSEQVLGNSTEAAMLLGASDAYIDAIGAHHGPAAHQSWHAITVDRLIADLGEADYERLHQQGRALPFNEAVERALSDRRA